MRLLGFLRKTIIVSFPLAVLILLGTPSTLASAIYPANQIGYDLSYPNCNAAYPENGFFGIVGITGGKAFTHNPCLEKEFQWAAMSQHTQTPVSVYINVNANIGSTKEKGMQGPYGICMKKEEDCQALNYGFNAAKDAFDYYEQMRAEYPSLAPVSMWWLDIETLNSWSNDQSSNQQVVSGALAFFQGKFAQYQKESLPVGIYSTPRMWNLIVGQSYKPGISEWLATAETTLEEAASHCDDRSFTGGKIALVQFKTAVFDKDYSCE